MKKDRQLRELGKKIRDARIKKGLKQSDLAQRIGFSVPIVSQWENGKREPSALTLILLINVLDLEDKELTQCST